MFGVTLRTSSVALREEVVRLFGGEVHEEESEIIGYHGQTHVNADGSPTIVLNATIRTEETIVHELFHLKAIAEGSPTISFIVPPDTPEPLQKAVLWLEHQLRGAIQHWMFYPQMRDMGLEPDGELNSEVQQIVQGSLMSDIKPYERQFNLAALLARFLLESSDSDLEAMFLQWCRLKMKPENIEKAMRMRDIVVAAKPENAKEEVTIFLECLNRLFQGTGGYFTVENWSHKMLGSFALSTVTFRFQNKNW